MSALSDWDEGAIELLEDVFPDILQAAIAPAHVDSIALIDRAKETIRATYMADTDGVEVDDLPRFKQDSSLAAEVVFQILHATAHYLTMKGAGS